MKGSAQAFEQVLSLRLRGDEARELSGAFVEQYEYAAQVVRRHLTNLPIEGYEPPTTKLVCSNFVETELVSIAEESAVVLNEVDSSELALLAALERETPHVFHIDTFLCEVATHKLLRAGLELSALEMAACCALLRRKHPNPSTFQEPLFAALVRAIFVYGHEVAHDLFDRRRRFYFEYSRRVLASCREETVARWTEYNWFDDAAMAARSQIEGMVRILPASQPLSEAERSEISQMRLKLLLRDRSVEHFDALRCQRDVVLEICCDALALGAVLSVCGSDVETFSAAAHVVAETSRNLSVLRTMDLFVRSNRVFSDEQIPQLLLPLGPSWMRRELINLLLSSAARFSGDVERQSNRLAIMESIQRAQLHHDVVIGYPLQTGSFRWLASQFFYGRMSGSINFEAMRECEDPGILANFLLVHGDGTL